MAAAIAAGPKGRQARAHLNGAIGVSIRGASFCGETEGANCAKARAEKRAELNPASRASTTMLPRPSRKTPPRKATLSPSKRASIVLGAIAAESSLPIGAIAAPKMGGRGNEAPAADSRKRTV